MKNLKNHFLVLAKYFTAKSIFLDLYAGTIGFVTYDVLKKIDRFSI